MSETLLRPDELELRLSMFQMGDLVCVDIRLNEDFSPSGGIVHLCATTCNAAVREEAFDGGVLDWAQSYAYQSV